MISRGLHSKGKKPFTIIVEGNIASGKTTLLNHFKNNGNVYALREPVELWKNVHGHNLFRLMYSDAQKWSFTFQTYVQLTMTQLHQAETDKPVKIMERSIYSARYCFVENLFKEKSLAEPQKIVLDEWFNWLTMSPSLSCDLIVYLQSDPKVVYTRMKNRCRKEEECVPLSYLENLHCCHENWLYHKTAFSCPAPVIVLDGNKDPESMLHEYRHLEKTLGVSTTVADRKVLGT